MKVTKAEAKAEAAEAIGAADTQPEFPWGLSIAIDDDTMQKLGMTTVPTTGKRFTITALAVVTNTSQYSTVGKDGESSFSLQITAMELMPGGDGNAASKIYGG